MELDDLYIFPEFRSKGSGTEIIQKCIEDYFSKSVLALNACLNKTVL